MSSPLESTIYLLTGQAGPYSISSYPKPDTMPIYIVCPSCKTDVSDRQVTGQGVMLGFYNCQRCGDVVPIRSAVRNPSLATEKSVATCSYCGHPDSAHFIGCSRSQYRIGRVTWIPFALNA